MKVEKSLVQRLLESLTKYQRRLIIDIAKEFMEKNPRSVSLQHIKDYYPKLYKIAVKEKKDDETK